MFAHSPCDGAPADEYRQSLRELRENVYLTDRIFDVESEIRFCHV